MEVIDLSGAIESGLWTYGPPNPEVKVEEIASIDNEGFSVSSLHMSILTGSYVETSLHMVPGRPSLDIIPVSRFVTTATVAKTPKAALQPITIEDLLPYEDLIRKNPTLLIETGWGVRFNASDYLTHSPYFEPETMEWLLGTPVNLLGADIPVYNDPRGGPVNVLHIYYQKVDNMIVAPLVNLSSVTQSEVQLVALPLKIKNQCAAPCRIVAIQE